MGTTHNHLKVPKTCLGNLELDLTSKAVNSTCLTFRTGGLHFWKLHLADRFSIQSTVFLLLLLVRELHESIRWGYFTYTSKGSLQNVLEIVIARYFKYYVCSEIVTTFASLALWCNNDSRLIKLLYVTFYVLIYVDFCHKPQGEGCLEKFL